MNIKKLTIFLTLILLLLPGISAERRDSLIVSLVTCWPGPEIYELCGHEALRTRRVTPDGLTVQGSDSVWNYGVFDFAQPHFVYRFVKGETDYMLAGYPFEWFMPEYQAAGRHVEEQQLNLTQPEAAALLARICQEAMPQNRTYRYNYVRDNCATRILDRLDETSENRIVYPDSVRFGTFRRAMRHYHKDYPWYQFGIDICLGAGIDIPITAREEMFAPLDMHRNAAGAHFSDGRPLVASTRVLNQGVADPTLGPTSPWLSPLAVALYVTALGILLLWWQWRGKRLVRWANSLWFGLLGLTGILVTFLVTVSSHEATSPNVLILWLNPLQLGIALGVWWRNWRVPVVVLASLNVVLLTVMLTVWPWQAQSANPAFFPLMALTLAMALECAIILQKYGYKKKNEEVNRLGAGSRGNRSRSSGRRRQAAVSGRNRR